MNDEKIKLFLVALKNGLSLRGDVNDSMVYAHRQSLGKIDEELAGKLFTELTAKWKERYMPTPALINEYLANVIGDIEEKKQREERKKVFSGILGDTTKLSPAIKLKCEFAYKDAVRTVRRNWERLGIKIKNKITPEESWDEFKPEGW